MSARVHESCMRVHESCMRVRESCMRVRESVCGLQGKMTPSLSALPILKSILSWFHILIFDTHVNTLVAVSILTQFLVT